MQSSSSPSSRPASRRTSPQRSTTTITDAVALPTQQPGTMIEVSTDSRPVSRPVSRAADPRRQGGFFADDYFSRPLSRGQRSRSLDWRADAGGGGGERAASRNWTVDDRQDSRPGTRATTPRREGDWRGRQQQEPRSPGEWVERRYDDDDGGRQRHRSATASRRPDRYRDESPPSPTRIPRPQFTLPRRQNEDSDTRYYADWSPPAPVRRARSLSGGGGGAGARQSAPKSAGGAAQPKRQQTFWENFKEFLFGQQRGGGQKQPTRHVRQPSHRQLGGHGGQQQQQQQQHHEQRSRPHPDWRDYPPPSPRGYDWEWSGGGGGGGGPDQTADYGRYTNGGAGHGEERRQWRSGTSWRQQQYHHDIGEPSYKTGTLHRLQPTGQHHWEQRPQRTGHAPQKYYKILCCGCITIHWPPWAVEEAAPPQQIYRNI